MQTISILNNQGRLLIIKLKIADCLSVLVNLKKKQIIMIAVITIHDLCIKYQVFITIAPVFALDSLACEFQIFSILLSAVGPGPSPQLFEKSQS